MRFTIRDLLGLTVVVALGVSWWVDRSALKQRIEILKKVVTPIRSIELIQVAPGRYEGEFPDEDVSLTGVPKTSLPTEIAPSE